VFLQKESVNCGDGTEDIRESITVVGGQRSAHGFVSRGNLSPVPDGQRPYE
jgi:hypothetical protein